MLWAELCPPTLGGWSPNPSPPPATQTVTVLESRVFQEVIQLKDDIMGARSNMTGVLMGSRYLGKETPREGRPRGDTGRSRSASQPC